MKCVREGRGWRRAQSIGGQTRAAARSSCRAGTAKKMARGPPTRPLAALLNRVGSRWRWQEMWGDGLSMPGRQGGRSARTAELQYLVAHWPIAAPATSAVLPSVRALGRVNRAPHGGPFRKDMYHFGSQAVSVSRDPRLCVLASRRVCPFGDSAILSATIRKALALNETLASDAARGPGSRHAAAVLPGGGPDSNNGRMGRADAGAPRIGSRVWTSPRTQAPFPRSIATSWPSSSQMQDPRPL